MAQQASNPQREPSMDEILASIRRIIEESEPDRPSVDLSAIEQLASGPTAIGPAANDVAQAAPKAEVQPVAPQQAAQAPVELPKALVEDPFAGIPSVDPATDIHVEMYSESFDVEPLSIDSELEAAFSQDDLGPEAPVVEHDMPAAEAIDPFVMAMSEATSTTAVERLRPILSEMAGRQVAASFGDLAEAFATNRNRRLDEVAEDMLRPMLQDWLDNNLPVLVERLVREEIERVARGG